MDVRFSRHALERMRGRGATEDEVETTIREGAVTAAKRNRQSARHTFDFNAASPVNGRVYAHKTLEVIYLIGDNRIVVVTVKVYYGNEEPK